MKADPYREIFSANLALNAVEQWADNCYLLRETGQVVPNGRLDGLLIPLSWEARVPGGIHGIEVKVSRADFLRGLRDGQFEKYDPHVASLWLAAPRDVCKTSEIPKNVGHLIVAKRDGEGLVCVCKRRATIKPGASHDVPIGVVWSILMKERAANREALEKSRRGCRKFGEIAADKVRRSIQEIERRCFE